MFPSGGGSHAAGPGMGARPAHRQNWLTYVSEQRRLPRRRAIANMTRTRRPIIPGATYFITSTAYQREKWFTRTEFAQIVVEQWKHYEKVYEFQLHTYCVLPDHYHVVLNVGAQKTISQILHAVNSYTATLINQSLGHEIKIKIWEGNAWDEVVRNENMCWQKIAYTLANPWRAGLVSKPLDPYPFSDLAEWLEREGEEFLLDLFARYKRWHE